MSTDSAWEQTYGGKGAILETWFYGVKSLEGRTRSWFIDEARQWPDGTELLDAGCGGGVTAYQLGQAGLLERLRYVGVDFTPEMLKLAESKTQHPNVTWRLGKLTALKGRYSRILLRAVLEHHHDFQPILRSVLRALSDDGVLYLIFWNNPVEGEPVTMETEVGVPDKSHNEGEMIEFIRSAGFEVFHSEMIDEPSARTSQRLVWKIRRCA